MQYLAIERQKICIRSPHAALAEQKQRFGCVHYIWHRQGSVAHSAASVAYGAGRAKAASRLRPLHMAQTERARRIRLRLLHAALTEWARRIRLRLLHMAQTERVRRAGCICCIWHRQSGRGDPAASVVYGTDRVGAASRLRLLHTALAEQKQRVGCVHCIWLRQSGRGDPAASVACGADRAKAASRLRLLRMAQRVGAAHPAACHAMKRGRFAIGAPFFMAS